MIFARRLALAPLFLAALAAAPASAQTADTSAPGAVVAAHDLVYTVADIDKSLAFYREVFGLTPERPTAPPISNPVLQDLSATPGSEVRINSLKLPGSAIGLEFTEFTGVDRHPVRGGVQDPGSSMLALVVTDLDAAVARAKTAGAVVITTGGVPIRQGAPDAKSYNRAIFLRDPDGFAMEVLQMYPGQPAPASTGGIVVSGGLALTVGDADRTAAFWKPFGVQVKVGAPMQGRSTMTELTATGNANMRLGTVSIPGAEGRWLIQEFTGIPRTPRQGRLQDPGTPAITLSVRDLDAAMAIIRQSGAPIVSVGGQVVHWPGRPGGSVFIRDPDGILFEIMQ